MNQSADQRPVTQKIFMYVLERFTARRICMSLTFFQAVDGDSKLDALLKGWEPLNVGPVHVGVDPDRVC